MNLKLLAQTLRADRKKAGLTQRGLAEAIGCSCTHISKIENQHSAASKSLLEAIAGALGVNADKYLSLAGKEDPAMLRAMLDHVLTRIHRLELQNKSLRVENTKLKSR